MVETKWFYGAEGIQDALLIRRDVFVEEQKVPKEIEYDEWDQKAFHLVVYDQGIPKATGRCILKEGIYSLGRIAVVKEARGQGFGDLVVRMLVRKAFQQGAKEVHLHAQLQVQDFYEKLGFEAYGEVYEEAGIDHISMVRKEDVMGSCC